MALTPESFRQLIGFSERSAHLLGRRIEPRDGYVVEHLQLEIGGEPVRGILTRPDAEGPHPAILYGHSHGGIYTIGARELLDGRDYLLDPPPGPVFARAGYVTLCIDMPVFGSRAGVTESFASKALLWHGKSLFVEMVADHSAALDYLAGRDDVDPARIGAFGISMGCVLSYWLAALDTRIAAVAHLCCLADMRTMIELGNHDGHGIYLMVPGLLNTTDNGEIAGLIAPRPQLVCIGEDDALTPPPAFQKAWSDTSDAYRVTPNQLTLISEPATGHRETPRMRAETLAFFARELGARASSSALSTG